MTNVETIPNGAKKSTKQEDEAFRRKLLQLWRDVEALEAAMVETQEQLAWEHEYEDWCEPADPRQQAA
jgi:hypothetical protein